MIDYLILLSPTQLIGGLIISASLIVGAMCYAIKFAVFFKLRRQRDRERQRARDWMRRR